LSWGISHSFKPTADQTRDEMREWKNAPILFLKKEAGNPPDGNSPSWEGI
jgi:hypothetical protein